MHMFIMANIICSARFIKYEKKKIKYKNNLSVVLRGGRLEEVGQVGKIVQIDQGRSCIDLKSETEEGEE